MKMWCLALKVLFLCLTIGLSKEITSCRYGGNDFLVVMPQTYPQHLLRTHVVTVLGLPGQTILYWTAWQSPQNATIGDDSSLSLTFRHPLLLANFNDDAPAIQKLAVRIRPENPKLVIVVYVHTESGDGYIATPRRPIEIMEFVIASFPVQGDCTTYLAVTSFVKDNIMKVELKLDANKAAFIGNREIKSGHTYMFTLTEKNDVLLVRSSGDMTGSRISGRGPISVFSGINCACVFADGERCQSVLEQMPRTNALGGTLTLPPMPQMFSSRQLRTVAASNGSVTFMGETVTLEEGEWRDWDIIETSVESPIGSSEFLLLQTFKNGENLPRTFVSTHAVKTGNFGKHFRVLAVPGYKTELVVLHTRSSSGMYSIIINGEERTVTEVLDTQPDVVGFSIWVEEGVLDIRTSDEKARMLIFIYSYGPQAMHSFPAACLADTERPLSIPEVVDIQNVFSLAANKGDISSYNFLPLERSAGTPGFWRNGTEANWDRRVDGVKMSSKEITASASDVQVSSGNHITTSSFSSQTSTLHDINVSIPDDIIHTSMSFDDVTWEEMETKQPGPISKTLPITQIFPSASPVGEDTSTPPTTMRSHNLAQTEPTELHTSFTPSPGGPDKVSTEVMRTNYDNPILESKPSDESPVSTERLGIQTPTFVDDTGGDALATERDPSSGESRIIKLTNKDFDDSTTTNYQQMSHDEEVVLDTEFDNIQLSTQIYHIQEVRFESTMEVYRTTIHLSSPEPMESSDNLLNFSSLEPMESSGNLLQHSTREPLASSDNLLHFSSLDPLASSDNLLHLSSLEPMESSDNPLASSVYHTHFTIYNSDGHLTFSETHSVQMKTSKDIPSLTDEIHISEISPSISQELERHSSTTENVSLVISSKDRVSLSTLCPCMAGASNSLLMSLMSMRRSELILNTKLLTAHIQKKISVPDDRVSSRNIGALGIALVVIPVVVVVFADVKNLVWR